MKFKLGLRLLAFIFVAVLSGFRLSAQDNIHTDKIDRYLENIEKNNLDVGSISVYKEGKEVYYRNFGKIPGQHFNKNSVYQVGSITKLFTSVLIFKLIESNKLSPDTRLSEFFPTIQYSDKITIRNLLEHSSGLNNYVKKSGKTVWLKEPRTDAELFAELKSQKPLFNPGDSVSYSNSGYYLLGKIIEHKYKDNYGNVLRKLITKPNKLLFTNSALQNPENVSKSYKFSEQGWVKNPDFYFKNIIGVGDISSNTSDLNKFINLLFEGRILEEKNLEVMKPVIGKETYGRGLMNFNFHGINFYGNTGGTYGTNTILVYEPKSKISISLIINGEQYERDLFIKDVVDIIFNNHLSIHKS